MNRAERRRQQKKANKQAGAHRTATTDAALQQTLSLALHHQANGRLTDALALCRQAVNAAPGNPIAHNVLGNILEAANDHAGAEECYRKALALHPDFFEAHFNLGNALVARHKLEEAADSYASVIALKADLIPAHMMLGNVLLDLGRIDEAEACYRKALSLNPDIVEAHFNLGNALVAQGKRTEAADSYAKAVALRTDLVPAHMALANVLLDLGRADEAEARYRKALAIDPEHIRAHVNLAEALKHQGDPEAAMQVLLDGARAHPDSEVINSSLILLLNYATPESSNPIVQAQNALSQMKPLTATDAETLRDAFAQCENVLAAHGLNAQTVESQIWFGKVGEEDCQRHMAMFNAFNAIPEYCFGCYKVSVTPRNVVELFKLMVVFDQLELPKNNSRKCFVELRAGISGAFKGLIYCPGQDDARKAEEIIRREVDEKISPDVAVSVKRGCSEFEAAYPEYARADESQGPPMAYDETWREHESYTDRYLAKHKYPSAFLTHDHTGFTVRDVLVMRKWLSYAKTIGDESYRTLTDTPVEVMDVGERPPFLG